MKRPSVEIGRRNFLVAVAAGGVTGTTAVVTATQSRSVQKRRSKGEPASSGYRLTEHVRNYYRTAKV